VPELVKLGELKYDARVSPRQKFTLDHVRCIQTDLLNGEITPEKLPPLLVERKSKVILDGTHRYLALKKYYGEGWKDREVQVEYVDLPPFEEEPVAWRMAALRANAWRVLRLTGPEREGLARTLVIEAKDPNRPELEEARRMLAFTKEAWQGFMEVCLEELKGEAEPEQPSAVAVEEKSLLRPTGPEDVSAFKRGTWPSQALASAKRATRACAKLREVLEQGSSAGLSDKLRQALEGFLEEAKATIEAVEAVI